MFSSTLFSLLLQFSLLALASAAPTDITTADNAWKYGSGGGVLGFIVLVLDIIVFIEVLKSSRPVTHKLAWSLIVFLFPILGIIIYWLFSNRPAHTGSGAYETIA